MVSFDKSLLKDATDALWVARAKVVAIRKKSVDWIDTYILLLGESIGKAIVSFQILEVLSDEAIQVLLCKKFESVEGLYCLKPRNFQRQSDTSTFKQKNLNRQSDCIVSNPIIFKGEAIQVLLHQKIWIGKVIVLFQTPVLARQPSRAADSSPPLLAGGGWGPPLCIGK
jgi:hypothetical protein